MNEHQQTQIIESTKFYIKARSENESSGHNWWHIYRVWKNALAIARHETVDMYIVQLAALLHDIADWKLHGGDETVGPCMARTWLQKCGVEESVIDAVCEIISDISFKGAGVTSKMKTPEGMVVQDADRLDALGAIGIARTFMYSGYKGFPMYDPSQQPTPHNSFEEYKNCKGSTINHFYEKLLLLKDLMNTTTAKKMAEERHRFMESFLKRFYEEWEGES